MEIPLKKLMQLHRATGVSVSDCRVMLATVEGDLEAAIEILNRHNKPSITTLFDESDWFTGPPLHRKLLDKAEARLGYKFPEKYVELLYQKNGGCTINDCFPVKQKTSWASDHISISGIRGIGGQYGIDPEKEEARNKEWGYPNVGLVFAETPTAGHTVVMFDYSVCGPLGEPRIIWVDVYGKDLEVIVLADNFSSFISGLVSASAYNARSDF